MRTQKEKQSVTASCVSVKICNSLSMSELDFPPSELRKLEEGAESFCSCMGLDTSPFRAPMNEIVSCCLFCLTSPETVPVIIRIVMMRVTGVLLMGIEPSRSKQLMVESDGSVSAWSRTFSNKTEVLRVRQLNNSTIHLGVLQCGNSLRKPKVFALQILQRYLTKQGRVRKFLHCLYG